MNYSIIWSGDAVSGLAEVWIASANRYEIALLTELFDRSVEINPFRVGLPAKSSVSRVAIVPPLGLSFDIVEDDKKVIVQSCWHEPDE